MIFKKYKIQIEEQQKLIEELYEKLEEKKTSCEKFQIEIKEIKSNNSVLDDKIQALETEKKQLEKDNDALHKNLHDSIEQRDELKIELNDKQEEFEKEKSKYIKLLANRNGEIVSAEEKINDILQYKKELESQIGEYEKNIEIIDKEIEKKIGQYIDWDDKVLSQSFEIYHDVYNYSNISDYTLEIKELQTLEKELFKKGQAITANKEWKIDGDLKKGKRYFENAAKQMIQYFNLKCKTLIDNLKISNYGKSLTLLKKSYEEINMLNEAGQLKISRQYYELKKQEFDLNYERLKKVQEEKEYKKLLREQRREELKAAKELEERREELEKERTHYQRHLDKILTQIQEEKLDVKKELLIEKRVEIEKLLGEIEEGIKDVDYRVANKKAGYVYVISNIGAFGENIYKIGMTRRLEPQDRIDELGGASVPFKFDVHAMIFSDDAPGLEAALHRAFEDKKVNMINGRKEFFNVSLEEIEKVVKENHDKTVNFVKDPEAEQYRASLLLKKLNG